MVSTCCLVFSVELGSTADTCSAFVYGAPFSAFCLVQQWIQVYASYGGWSVYGRLNSGNGFSEAMGYELFLATVTLLRRASLCRVSWGVWRKVSSPEVLRLFFCEHRMRCVFVWCSSYSSQWTGHVPGSFFLDKDVDVPVLATSWVVELIMAW